MIDLIHGAAERFFGLPEEEKMKIYIGKSQVGVNLPAEN